MGSEVGAGVTPGASGAQQRISQLWPGAVIGEMSWLDGLPTSATIEALEPSEVLAISGTLLDDKIAADPGFVTPPAVRLRVPAARGDEAEAT